MKRQQLAGRYAIVGVGEAGIGKAAPGDTALSLQCRAARDALLEAGLKPGDVDGIYAHWDERYMALQVAEYMGITPRVVDTTAVGGQSNLTHLVHAMAAIESGLCEVALVTYGSTQRLDRSRQRGGAALDARTPMGQFVTPYGQLVPIGWYAMLAKLYMERYGVAPESLGEVVLASRRWAALNPYATQSKPLTMQDYLAAPMLSDPLRKYDVCLVSDAAGAMVLTRAERARDLAHKPVLIQGFADAYLHYGTPFGTGDWLDNRLQRGLADDALAMAGLDRKAIDLVQIYDAFSINVLLGLEALGFCAQGTAGEFIRDGHIAPGGAFPVNTSGGGLSFNHPGQYGMQLMVETVRQLRGECGARQVGNAHNALVLAGGLVMSAHMVMVLGTV